MCVLSPKGENKPAGTPGGPRPHGAKFGGSALADLEAVRLAQRANKPAGTLAGFARRWRANLVSAQFEG